MTEASYFCAACGGVVQLARKEAHDRFWCQAAGTGSAADGSEESEEEQEAGAQEIPQEVLRLTSSQYDPELRLGFSFAPGVTLRVAQRVTASGRKERHTDHETGGQFWSGELVLAEFLALDCQRAAEGPRDLPAPGCRGRAIALGCGAAPASAFVAAALGWHVLLTDLEQVLPLTRSNVGANQTALAMLSVALRGEGAECGELATAPLPFGEPISEQVRSWAGAEGFNLILGSELLWQAHRHRALASTLAELLAPPLSRGAGSRALVAFQRRGMSEEGFFGLLAREGLGHRRCAEAAEAVRQTQLPEQLRREIAMRDMDPAEWFFVHHIWSLFAGTAEAGNRSSA